MYNMKSMYKTKYKNYIWAVSLLLAALLCSCGQETNRYKKEKLEDSELIETPIIRMDKEVYQLDSCITKPVVKGDYMNLKVNIPDNDSICLSEKIEKIHKKHQEKFRLYIRQIGAMTGDNSLSPATLFYLFLSHPAYNELFQDCEKEYTNVSDLEKEFSTAFSRAKKFVPSYNIPEICTFFSGFAEYIAADSATLYISLEYFLGADYKNYKYVDGIYDYMIPNLKREKIVPDALYNWTCSEYILQQENGNLLDNMIHYGKILYFIEALLPERTIYDILGYDKEKADWCIHNEKQMWNYLREYNQLFSTDSKTIADYLFPANCTKYFSTEENLAPDRAVLWMGWRIISEYMKRNESVSLDQLLNDSQKEAQTILQESSYNP